MEKRKINIIFVCYQLEIGGTTSALLALLKKMNPEQYNITLLLPHGGTFDNMVPEYVSIKYIGSGNKKNIFKKTLDSILAGTLLISLRAKFLRVLGKNTNRCSQLYAKKIIKIQNKMPELYDIAVGYLEMWPTYYIVKNINAKKKLAFLHVDYEQAKMDPKIDSSTYSSLDGVICISSEVNNNFRRVFPHNSHISYYIDNLLDIKGIMGKANEFETEIGKMDSDKSIKIITVARLSNQHKGIDRGINCISRAVKEGYNVKWYLVGDGDDRKVIEDQIRNEHMENNIFVLGMKNNPYPYIAAADLFMLPSRYEGKPIVVYEAHVLGVPTLVTNYSSAKEQVKNNINGWIVDNNTNSLFEGLKDILNRPNHIKTMKRQMKNDVIEKQGTIAEQYRKIFSI